MATIERRNNRFRLIFYHRGRRYAASLKPKAEREANAVAGGVERTLMLLAQGPSRSPRAPPVPTIPAFGWLRTRIRPGPRFTKLSSSKCSWRSCR